jgi:hypothetical protein
LNGNINAAIATYKAANNYYMKAMRAAHECIINSAKLDEYKPLEMPNPPRLIRTYLPDSTDINNLRSFLDIFLKNDDFNEITVNINTYTK